MNGWFTVVFGGCCSASQVSSFFFGLLIVWLLLWLVLYWPWIGLEAKALAWLFFALALQNHRPRLRVGFSLAWPGFGPGQGFSYKRGRDGEGVYWDGGGGGREGVHRDEGWGDVKNPTTVFCRSTWASPSTLNRVGTSAGLIIEDGDNLWTRRWSRN